MTGLRGRATVVATIPLIAACAAAAVQPGRSPEPMPLRGVPLARETGLRLLVANNPPFVLDVDRGRTARLSGARAITGGVLTVVGVAGRAAVVLAQYPQGRLYAVRGRAARASYLGRGSDVVPAGRGRAVWVKSSLSRSRCTLRKVGLNGRQLVGPRAFRCAATISFGGSVGLVVSRTRVIDPLRRRTVLKSRWGVIAAARERLVLAGPGRRMALLDATTRAQLPVRWPSILLRLDQPAVDPRGRFVALAFADPARKGAGRQALDVWLLDAETGNLTQMPGMPAFVALKRTSMAWTDDGRLVLLGESAGKDVVAVWRPGQRRLAVKTVRLPQRTSGSDSFAPLR